MNKYLKMEFNEEKFKEEIKNKLEKEINKAKEKLERGPDVELKPIEVNVGLNAMHFLDAVFDKEEIKPGNVIEMIKDTQNMFAGKRFLVTKVYDRGVIAIRVSEENGIKKIIINSYDVRQNYREFEVVKEAL